MSLFGLGIGIKLSYQQSLHTQRVTKITVLQLAVLVIRIELGIFDQIVTPASFEPQK